MVLGTSVMAVFSIMTVLWLWHLPKKNAGIVDLGWVLGFPVSALIYALADPGPSLRKFFLVLLVVFWSSRLLVHLAKRFFHENAEDPRYGAMRAQWGASAPWMFLGVFWFQALTVVLLSAVFIPPMTNADRALSLAECVVLGVALIAVMGEAVADHQLAKFKKDPKNKGQVCQVGLWNYSRHPNYFFECVVWVCYGALACLTPGGAWAVYAPLLMLYFILKVSGVGPSEAQALKSRGELYVRYQKTTSVLIPWFKRKVA